MRDWEYRVDNGVLYYVHLPSGMMFLADWTHRERAEIYQDRYDHAIQHYTTEQVEPIYRNSESWYFHEQERASLEYVKPQPITRNEETTIRIVSKLSLLIDARPHHGIRLILSQLHSRSVLERGYTNDGPADDVVLEETIDRILAEKEKTHA